MDWGQIFNQSASSIISTTTIAYALAALGLGVHFGQAGLLNMGVAGFMAVGAYGYAISILTFGFPWWLAAIVALLAAVVFAMILGVPTLRLRGDYLAIVTIAAAEVLRLLLLTVAFEEVTGSADGLYGYSGDFQAANPIPDGEYGFGPWQFNQNELWPIVIGIILLALAVLLVWAMMRSPWGRVLRGIREDEDAVRMFGARALRNKGYNVLEAENGEEALDVINGTDENIDLIISDVVMPGMDGHTLVRLVRHELPDVKVILMSGYAEDVFRDEIDRDPTIQFLAKPFSLRGLASKVKEVIVG